MKKILLTLGTTVAIATPLATVVACGSSTTTKKPFEPSFDETTKELTIARTTYVNKSGFEATITEASIKSFLNDLHTVLSNSVYDTSEKIKLTKNGEETKTETITISDITFEPGTTSTNVNPTTLAEVKALAWEAVENASVNGSTMNLTANENMAWQLFSKEKTIIIEDDSPIVNALNQLNITSTKPLTELTSVAGTPATTEADANTRFGIVQAEFNKITTALGGETSNWKFVSIDFDTTESKFKLTYKHALESTNREINLTTTSGPNDDSGIVSALNQLNIHSTKMLTELTSVAGTPATTEADANTRFGIVKTEFDSIITALGGPTSDWKFVNIDFTSLSGVNRFKLTYKHSLESANKDIYLVAIPSLDDSAVVSELIKFRIISTKNIDELIAAAGTPATTEADANTRFGVSKTYFDLIITALGGPTSDWKFVRIDFNKETSKFGIIYKHSSETHERIYNMIATPAQHDNSAVVTELNKITITSTKTLKELFAAVNAGTPAATEEAANTKYGIVKTEWDKIITALGGPTSGWRIISISFSSIDEKFNLLYGYENEYGKTILLATSYKPV